MEETENENIGSKESLAKRTGIERRRIFYMVHHSPPLMAQLRLSGYRKMQRSLTGRQYRLICDYFGITPEEGKTEK